LCVLCNHQYSRGKAVAGNHVPPTERVIVTSCIRRDTYAMGAKKRKSSFKGMLKTHFPQWQLAVIDRRLCPRCCHLESYFKRPKSSPVRPSACIWYYCAQFIAKPKAACALRFSLAAASSNLGLWENMTSSIKPEIHNVPLRRQRTTEPQPWVSKKIGEGWTCTSWVKKTRHPTLGHNFTNYYPIFNIFH